MALLKSVLVVLPLGWHPAQRGRVGEATLLSLLHILRVAGVGQPPLGWQTAQRGQVGGATLLSLLPRPVQVAGGN